MNARDVDMHDVVMMTDLSEELAEQYDSRAGRLLAIAGLIHRHHAEMAECEHGALRGRCEVDGCEVENFESDHVVNRAVDVRDQVGYGMSLSEAIEAHSFDASDFQELTRLAWIGARVAAAASPPTVTP